MQGNVILVTGAARRIGRAIALRLAAPGVRLAVHHRSSEADTRETARLVRERGAEAEVFCADLSSAEATLGLARSVTDRFGGVDVLVNNASAFFATPLDQTSAAELVLAADLFHAVHVRAPLLLVHALRPSLRSVVNLTDAALSRPRSRFAPYVASKAALAALTSSLARELAPRVRVNAVAPGSVLPPSGATNEEVERLRAFVPSGRLGTAEEVADAVAWLVDGPEFVTGVTLPVDGGQYG